MNNLQSVLEKMQHSVCELELLQVEELKQLEQVSINPVSLQMITDMKSQLLSRLRYHDELRMAEEEKLQIKAPYEKHVNLSKQWCKTREHIDKCNILSKKVFVLLDMHMNKTRKINTIINNNKSELSIYSAQGTKSASPQGKIYNLSI